MSAEVIGSPRLDVTLLFLKDSLQILAFLFQLLVHQAIDFERLKGTPKSRLGRTKGVLQMCNTKCLAVQVSFCKWSYKNPACNWKVAGTIVLVDGHDLSIFVQCIIKSQELPVLWI